MFLCRRETWLSRGRTCNDCFRRLLTSSLPSHQVSTPYYCRYSRRRSFARQDPAKLCDAVCESATIGPKCPPPSATRSGEWKPAESSRFARPMPSCVHRSQACCGMRSVASEGPASSFREPGAGRAKVRMSLLCFQVCPLIYSSCRVIFSCLYALYAF